MEGEAMGQAIDRIEDPAMLDYALGEVEAAFCEVSGIVAADRESATSWLSACEHLAEAVRVMRGE